MLAPEIIRRAAGFLKAKSHEEGRALSECALYGDRPAHLRDKSPAYGYSEAGSLHSRNVIEAPDIVEQSLLQFTAHSDSVVADLEGNFSVT